MEIQYNTNQLDKIELVKNHPTHLKYNFEACEDQLLVFSEMYYPKGWSVSIDKQITDFFPINYVLRGLELDKGENTIEMIFEPNSYTIGNVIIKFSNYLLLLLTLLLCTYEFRKKYK